MIDNQSVLQAVILAISAKVLSLEKTGPILVGIDGVDGSGKSQFASQLAKALVPSQRQVLQSSVDFFHNKASVRKPAGKDLAASFYENSFNYAVLASKLLDPLSKKTGTKVYLRHFDHRVDAEVEAEPVVVRPDAVLVFDGIFLHRPETRHYWDLSIFLDVSFAETYKRMAVRDGCPEDYRDERNARYYKGQQIYLEQCQPQSKADIVIDNNDYKNPRIVGIEHRDTTWEIS